MTSELSQRMCVLAETPFSDRGNLIDLMRIEDSIEAVQSSSNPQDVVVEDSVLCETAP